jgi:hypothetical protein
MVSMVTTTVAMLVTTTARSAHHAHLGQESRRGLSIFATVSRCRKALEGSSKIPFRNVSDAPEN